MANPIADPRDLEERASAAARDIRRVFEDVTQQLAEPDDFLAAADLADEFQGPTVVAYLRRPPPRRRLRHYLAAMRLEASGAQAPRPQVVPSSPASPRHRAVVDMARLVGRERLPLGVVAMLPGLDEAAFVTAIRHLRAGGALVERQGVVVDPVTGRRPVPADVAPEADPDE